MRRARHRLAAGALVLAAPATLLAQAHAVGEQSALRPGGPAAREIGELWNLLLWLGGAATVVTVALLAYALLRRRRPDELPPEADRPADPRGEASNEESGGRGRAGEGRPPSERAGARWMIIGGLAVPAVVLGVVLFATLRVLAHVSTPASARAEGDALPRRGDPLTIEVLGRQFWWEVRYLASEPAGVFTTANELRIPVGRPVRLRVRGADVIHSLWVPGLHGKMDLIPGRTNILTVQASRPGVFRGQCAEFCGVQHGKMALVVVAEPEDRYRAWEARQRLPAAVPSGARVADQRAFLASGCVLCHAVRGTPAGGRLGPDLTHLASRLTLAAGTLPNVPGNLYGWVADPQAHKPGSQMPSVPLAAADLHAIVRYLATLE